MNEQSNQVLSTGESDIIGACPIRPDGLDKVMGRARYAADTYPAVLYGKILRRPHSHARIKGIDTARSLALPGVKSVTTAADLPEVSAAIVNQEEGGCTRVTVVGHSPGGVVVITAGTLSSQVAAVVPCHRRPTALRAPHSFPRARSCSSTA